MKQYEARSATAVTIPIVQLEDLAWPSLAVHDVLGCSSDSGLQPLVLMTHNVVNLIVFVGVLIAVASLVWAGIQIMWGTEDAKRSAIKRVQRAVVGVGLLVVAPYVVAFLIAPFSICTGGV